MKGKIGLSLKMLGIEEVLKEQEENSAIHLYQAHQKCNLGLEDHGTHVNMVLI